MMLLLVLVLLVAVHYLSREYSRYAHHIVQARNDFRCDNVKMWKTLFFLSSSARNMCKYICFPSI